jgi:hypothetical protein
LTRRAGTLYPIEDGDQSLKQSDNGRLNVTSKPLSR